MQIRNNAELEALNEILSVVGESPVNTLDNLQNLDAINALRILRTQNKLEQGRGWSFNTINDYTLVPDTQTRTIAWNDNYLELKGDSGENLGKYSGYVRDVSTNSIYFDKPIQVTAVLLMEFEDMPLALRNYIVAKSAYAFCTRYLMSAEMMQVTLQTMQEAWQIFMEFEVNRQGLNMLDNTYVSGLARRG